jgi:hypothetical protein
MEFDHSAGLCPMDGRGPPKISPAQAAFSSEYFARTALRRDGDWHIAYCAAISGANGQGRNREEALQSRSITAQQAPGLSGAWLAAA